jgi:hypothetical protein
MYEIGLAGFWTSVTMDQAIVKEKVDRGSRL